MKQILFLIFIFVELVSRAAPPAIEQQARALQTVLRQADDAYYNKHQPELSDAVYDSLRNQYARLGADYPELAGENPVGTPVGESGRKVAHAAPVLSLDKVYSDKDLGRFLQQTGEKLLYCVEPKIDGVSIVLRYRDGLLVQALTRGDGKTGADITSAVLASGSVPARLTNTPPQLDVRGEMFLSRPAFEKLNWRRKESGQEPLTSPRNIASGTLMLTDYTEIAKRGLEFQCFELLATDRMPPTHTEALALMKGAGLPVVESRTVSAFKTISAVNDLNRRRAGLPFMTDGVVIKVDDLTVCKKLGATTHHPHSAIARKYEEAPVETKLLKVEWSRGASGKLTPVAVFEPVKIKGATIERASLYNMDYIRAMDLRLGDWINVIRSGGTVPEIIGICPDRRTGAETVIPDPVK